MTAARKLVDPCLENNEQLRTVVAPRTKAKRRRVPATVKICLLAACCVAVSLLYLQQEVTFYHLNMELAQLSEKANHLEQKNSHLMLDLESQRSLQKIEHLARTKLGMVDPERTTALVVAGKTKKTVEGGRWFDEQQVQNDTQGIFATLANWLNKAFPLGGVEAGTLQR